MLPVLFQLGRSTPFAAPCRNALMSRAGATALASVTTSLRRLLTPLASNPTLGPTKSSLLPFLTTTKDTMPLSLRSNSAGVSASSSAAMARARGLFMADGSVPKNVAVKAAAKMGTTKPTSAAKKASGGAAGSGGQGAAGAGVGGGNGGSGSPQTPSPAKAKRKPYYQHYDKVGPDTAAPFPSSTANRRGFGGAPETEKPLQ